MDELEDLYERAPCGYFTMEPDGRIVKLNETLVGWLGLPREQILGTRFQDRLTVAGRIYHDTHYMPLLTMQGLAREIAFDLQRPNAPPLPVMVTTLAERDASGAVVRYRAAVFEASSRRSYEREIVRQRQAAEHEATARSALLAMLSHDIRSPLSSIVMAIDLLEDSNAAAERARYASLVRKAAHNVLDLVNAILDHSRLEAGAAAWEPQPTDLRALLGEIVAIHSVKAESKRIELRTHVDGRVPATLLLDRYKLGQVITNLVSNAIKFTERGHVVAEIHALRVDAREAELQLRVADTGAGIAADQLATIFDEYKQVSPAAALRFGGAGLGLAISRKLAALAGTTIEIESEVGRGTTFTCVLRAPVVPAV